jgi:hypothetical protein
MSADEHELGWKIDSVREPIRLDWEDLASRNFTVDQRKAIREHLKSCHDTLKVLKDLVERNRAASQRLKLENHHRLRGPN